MSLIPVLPTAQPARPAAAPPCVQRRAEACVELMLGAGSTLLPMTGRTDHPQPLQPRQRLLQRGDALFRSGDRQRALFITRRGSLKTTALSAEGEERVLGFHLPGELLGLDALGSGLHRCEAVALEETEVCEFGLGQLESSSLDLPQLQRQLLTRMGRSVALDQDHMAMLARPQAIERVAQFVLGLARRLGCQALRGGAIELPMGRGDIAAYLGLVIETVSRAMRRLHEERVLSVRVRRLRILDLERLRALAHESEAPVSTCIGACGRAAEA
jgi:CRP/FNR family transcriptional regulator, anaerobic regulatory protein